MTETLFIGWDIGGAHLKVAAASAAGELLFVQQLPCPLWRGTRELEQAMKSVLEQQPSLRAGRHAITMTGELADCFANRHDGVIAIIAAVSRILGHQDYLVYASDAGLMAPAAACARTQAVASANWLVTTQCCSEAISNFSESALLVDIGSTTTDLIPLQQLPACNSDADRLVSGELIYTGVVRTPVMAFCREVTFAGQHQSVMAELFATAADVHRLTGALPPDCDQADTADGNGKDTVASARRLARMLGRDLEEASLEAWQDVARQMADKQCHLLVEGIRRLQQKDGATTLIGAGSGRFLLPQIAQQLNCRYHDIADLFDVDQPLRDDMAQCAPAACLALLCAAMSARQG